jgi:hypothetical protein
VKNYPAQNSINMASVYDITNPIRTKLKANSKNAELSISVFSPVFSSIIFLSFYSSQTFFFITFAAINERGPHFDFEIIRTCV